MEKHRAPYGKWSHEDLHQAVSAIQRGDFGLNEASRLYGVPKATLSRHMNGKNEVANLEIKFHGSETTLGEQLDRELAEHCLLLESMYFGLRIDDIRKLAFDLAEANNVPHKFNREKGMAGKKWFYSFMQRHQELSVREPESTYIARAQGFNKERVRAYFDLLRKIYDEEKLTPDRLFNMGESNLSTVQDGQSKGLSVRRV